MVLQTAQDTHRALRHLINKAQLTGKTEELSEFISTTTNDLKDVLPPSYAMIFSQLLEEKNLASD